MPHFRLLMLIMGQIINYSFTISNKNAGNKILSAQCPREGVMLCMAPTVCKRDC